jgi:uncharacterized protein YqhQ
VIDRQADEKTDSKTKQMSKTLKFIAIVSLLAGILHFIFCIWFYLQLPGLEPGEKITVEMYQNLLNAIKALVFKVILFDAAWLAFVSIIVWKSLLITARKS